MNEYTNWVNLYRQKRYNEILWRWMAVLRFWMRCFILWYTAEREAYYYVPYLHAA